MLGRLCVKSVFASFLEYGRSSPSLEHVTPSLSIFTVELPHNNNKTNLTLFLRTTAVNTLHLLRHELKGTDRHSGSSRTGSAREKSILA